MSFNRKTTCLCTSKQAEHYNITKDVQRIVEENGTKNGLAIVRTLHTTAAIFVNEDEKGLLEDMKNMLERAAPENQEYAHDDPTIHRPEDENERRNGFAHLRAMLLGSEVNIPIVEGKLSLGRWQSILFMELDGPRKERHVEITIIGG